MEARGVDEALVGPGDVALVVDKREGFEVLVHLDEALTEGGEGAREGLGVWYLTPIDLVPEWEPVPAGAEQSHPDLAEVMALLLVVTPGSSAWALVEAIKVKKFVAS